MALGMREILLLALSLISATPCCLASRLPLSLALDSEGAPVLTDKITPASARRQIQAAISSFSSALQGGDVATAVQGFASELVLLPPDQGLAHLTRAGQEEFVDRLLECGVRFQFTIADLLAGVRVAVPVVEPTGNNLPVGSAISRINYVVFSEDGDLLEAGKIIGAWHGTPVKGPFGSSARNYSWTLRWALWSLDSSTSGLRSFLSTALHAVKNRRNEYPQPAWGGVSLEDVDPVIDYYAVLQKALDDFVEDIKAGDVLGAASLLAPCVQLLPPAKPSSVLHSTIDVTRMLQALMELGLVFRPTVKHVELLKVKGRPFPPCSTEAGLQSPLEDLEDGWAVAVGLIEIANLEGEVVGYGKFAYVFRPVFRGVGDSMGDEFAGYHLQLAAWNLDGPLLPGYGPALSEGTGSRMGSSSVTPGEALGTLRQSIHHFLVAVADNDTLTASSLFARTAFVLSPGAPALHLATPEEKAAFISGVFAEQLRYQLTVADIALGAPEAFAPIPSGNSGKDLVALSHVNYLAFEREGAIADSGKLLLLWVRDGLGSRPGASWKLYWLAFNSDVKGSTEGTVGVAEGISRMADLGQGGGGLEGDLKPAAVLEQLSLAVEDLGAALAARNATLAARIFAPTVLLLPSGHPAREISLDDDKEAAFQGLVTKQRDLVLSFDEVVLASLSFLSEGEADGLNVAAAKGGPLYAITRGTYSIFRKGSEGQVLLKQGHAVLVWQPSPAAADSRGAMYTYGVRWALWSNIPLDGPPQIPLEGHREDVPPVRGLKPAGVIWDLSLAFANLSLISSKNETEAAVGRAVLGPNVTVLAPGLDLEFLNDTDAMAEFFNTSFLPITARFNILGLAYGAGMLSPPPPPPAAPAQAADLASNDNDVYLVISFFQYLDYSDLAIGKGIALWVSSLRVNANGIDRYLWNLSAIGWSSDLPAAPGTAAAHWEGANRLMPGWGELTALAEPVDLSRGGGGGGRRELIAEERGQLADKKVPIDVWGGLNESISAAVANLSAGDLANASLILSPVAPVLILLPGSPPPVSPGAVTPEEKAALLKPLLGLEVEVTLDSVWQLTLKDSVTVGGGGFTGSSGAGDAFTIGTARASNKDGEVVFRGSFLALWDGVTGSSSYLGDSKVPGRWAIRWLFWSPLDIPAPPPSAAAPAPGPDAAGAAW